MVHGRGKFWGYLPLRFVRYPVDTLIRLPLLISAELRYWRLRVELWWLKR